MVKLPDPADMRVALPSAGRQNIVSYQGGEIAANAMIRGGQQLTGLGEQAERIAERERQEADRLRKARALLDYEKAAMDKMQAYSQSPDKWQTFEPDFAKWDGEVRGKILSGFQGRDAELMGIELEERAMRGLQAVRNERDKFARQGALVQAQDDADFLSRKVLSGADVGSINKDLYVVAQQIDSNPYIDPAEKDRLRRSIATNVQTQIVDRDFRADPIGTLNGIRGAVKSGAEAILARELGAGGKIYEHSDGDGMAIAGINSEAYPQQFAEIKQILQTQGDDAAKKYALDFYQKEFVSNPKVANLAPEVQDVVADGLVNHWSGFQKDLLAAANAGASRQELIEMRRAEYARLTRANPEKYGKNAEGWERRLRGLEESQPSPYSSFAPDVLAKGLEVGSALVAQKAIDMAEANIALASDGQPTQPIPEEMLATIDIRKPGFSVSYKRNLEAAKAQFDMLSMSPQQMNETIAKFTPDPAKPDEYADARKTFDVLAAARDAAIKRQNERTAETAMQADPRTRDLYEVFAQNTDNADAFRAYADSVTQYAQGVGVMEPKLLPEQLANQFAQSISAKYEDREQRFRELERIRLLSGEYFEGVINQVSVKAGPAVLVAANFYNNNPMNMQLAATIMNNYTDSDDALSSVVKPGTNYPKTGVNDIIANDNFINKISDLENFMRAAAPDDVVMRNETKRQIARAALVYAGSGGMSLDDAVTKALTEATGALNFVSQSATGLYGVGTPPIAVPAQFADQSSKIQLNAERLVDFVADNNTLQVDMESLDGLGKREDIDINESVKQYAYWVADNKINGVRLVMPSQNGNTNVRNKAGENIAYSWDDFVAFNFTQQRRAQKSDDFIDSSPVASVGLLAPLFGGSD